MDHVSAQIDLGTAASFGVIASSAITNTGATIVTGSLGLSPNTGSSITGFPPGLSGDVHAGDAVADQARQDARTAYNTASSLASTSQIAGADLGGQTLVSGVYTSPSAVGLTGTLTLDGQNDADSLFVFQIGSTLTTASSASVVLVNGARACNVFFQIGSSATLGSSTTFNGNILALTSISLLDGVSVTGGLYAVNGAVTLINDRIVSQQECVTVTTSTVLVIFRPGNRRDIIKASHVGHYLQDTYNGQFLYAIRDDHNKASKTVKEYHLVDKFFHTKQYLIQAFQYYNKI
ncbi:hypothetical protein SLS61_007795 [Didymella pomorum]